MIVVRTPLRISFIGGGSDLKSFYEKHEGMVISSTIDKYVYVIVKERFDDLIYINYSRKEIVERVDDIKHDLVRESMKITGVDRGVEITTLADVPSEGSGLGSSSSLTVALLHALYTFKNELVTAERLAQEACRIEIDILKKPIGKQDQYAAAYGGLNKFIFHRDGSVERIPVSLNNNAFMKLSSSLMLYWTGLTRSADEILQEQNRNLVSEKEKLEIMKQMVGLVDDFKDAVEKEDIKRCGKLLDRNWELKKRMASKISNSRIEVMYRKAKEAGAEGCKIAGAGGGGFMMLIVPRESYDRVLEVMREYRFLPFMLERGGSKVIFEERRYPAK